MTVNISTKGYYFNYKTKVVVITKHGTISAIDEGNIEFELNSTDDSTPADSTTTLHNFPEDMVNKIANKDHVIVYSGSTDLYGIAGEGNITNLSKTDNDGKDKQFVMTFKEGTDYSQNKLSANFNGAKTVKSKSSKSSKKDKKKKINATFAKGTKAKAIITKVAKLAKIKIYHLKLKKNKVYKRGYTVSSNPYNALKHIVKDCESVMYQRKGKLVIDDNQSDNPYNEHLYLSLGSGLLAEPSISDESGKKKTYTLECWDDPRLSAGSSVYVKSKKLDNLYRVKSVKHTHSKNYRMEVVIYA